MTTSMRSISLVALRKSLGDVISHVQYTHERTAVNKHGKTVAVIIPVEDLEVLERLEDQADLEALRQARQEDDGTRIPLKGFLAEDTANH